MFANVIRSQLALIGRVVVALFAATACQSAAEDVANTPHISQAEPTDESAPGERRQLLSSRQKRQQ